MCAGAGRCNRRTALPGMSVAAYRSAAMPTDASHPQRCPGCLWMHGMQELTPVAYRSATLQRGCAGRATGCGRATGRATNQPQVRAQSCGLRVCRDPRPNPVSAARRLVAAWSRNRDQGCSRDRCRDRVAVALDHLGSSGTATPAATAGPAQIAEVAAQRCLAGTPETTLSGAQGTRASRYRYPRGTGCTICMPRGVPMRRVDALRSLAVTKTRG
jgi:hypothetical protein